MANWGGASIGSRAPLASHNRQQQQDEEITGRKSEVTSVKATDSGSLVPSGSRGDRPVLTPASAIGEITYTHRHTKPASLSTSPT
ncbi:unnamed protein product [Protopolystoma xenopodis]|uniref:Uncharacterized protein n=1 Tax=Protopolystoma xenopodis TaxID=117903 RepID=A0A448X940_9PLAT|nr:unnamed protein product [Protopolystoma xenopodis]